MFHFIEQNKSCDIYVSTQEEIAFIDTNSVAPVAILAASFCILSFFVIC